MPPRLRCCEREANGMHACARACTRWAVSCVVTLVVAYLLVYGTTLSGFAAYTHTVGHVFNPAVSLIFGLKILSLGLTVAVMPIASVLDTTLTRSVRTSSELRGLVRMFLIILLIEAASL